MPNITLYHDDCLNIFPQLEDKSIDLTVTSPPYDNLRTYNNSLVWNNNIWKNIIKELHRITKDGGIVVWIVADATIKGSETGTSFKQALYAMECGFNLHDTMIYQSDKTPLSHNRYEPNFEYMFIWSKGKPKTFNPILKKNKHFGAKGNRNHNSASTKEGIARRPTNQIKIIKEFGVKSNVWYYPTGLNNSSKDRIAFQHPAIFPEALAEDHILSWSNENDLIFDPMMGSGTVGKMAIKNNRNFIGIEKEEKYFNIAKERIGG